MDTKEIIAKALQEFILPELDTIKHDNAEIKAVLNVTNKRLDDFNNHLVGQSKRIDDINKRIDAMNDKFEAKFDAINDKFDAINDKLNAMNDKFEAKFDAMNDKFEAKFDIINDKFDAINDRINQLYLVIVRRDEHDKIEVKVMMLEEKINDIIKKLAA